MLKKRPINTILLLHHVEHYYHQPKFIEYWTNKINETLEQIPQDEHDETILVVSTHSLPKGLIEKIMIHTLMN